MSYALVPAVVASLTANGTNDGVLTIASTANLVQGSFLWLTATGQTSVYLQIVTINADGVTFTVRSPTSTSYFTYFNATAYTTAASAAIQVPPGYTAYAPATDRQN